jgi:hypothetical protein
MKTTAAAFNPGILKIRMMVKISAKAKEKNSPIRAIPKVTFKYLNSIGNRPSIY